MLGLRSKRSGGVPVSRAVHRLIRAGDAARDADMWPDAARLYGEAVAVDPGLAHVWVQRGHALRMAGRAAEAAGAYERGAAADPVATDPPRHLARLQLNAGDMAAAAEAAYSDVLARSPDDAEARRVVADAAMLRSGADAPVPSPNLPDGLTLAETQALMDGMLWHHAIDFGDGLVSKAIASPGVIKLTAAALFHGLDLSGRSLLDIGAWNGAYSFAAKRRGAGRVVASDKIAWTDAKYDGRRTFDLGCRLTGLDIEARQIDVPDITPASVGCFDIVLFAGVFYHLIDPIHLTQRISECADHLLILETAQDALEVDRPAMIFYPGTTLVGDGSNWWGPNPHCLYELLTELGFGAIHYRDAPLHPPGLRGLFHAYRDRASMAHLGVSGPPEGWLDLSDPENRRRLFAPVPSD